MCVAYFLVYCTFVCVADSEHHLERIHICLKPYLKFLPASSLQCLCISLLYFYQLFRTVTGTFSQNWYRCLVLSNGVSVLVLKTVFKCLVHILKLKIFFLPFFFFSLVSHSWCFQGLTQILCAGKECAGGWPQSACGTGILPSWQLTWPHH